MVVRTGGRGETYIPSKNHQHNPQRHLPNIPLEPALRLSRRILQRIPTNFQHILSPRNSGGDFLVGITDRPPHLFSDFAGKIILLFEEELEGFLYYLLTFGERCFAPGLEGCMCLLRDLREFFGGCSRAGEDW